MFVIAAQQVSAAVASAPLEVSTGTKFLAVIVVGGAIGFLLYFYSESFPQR